MPIQNPDGYDYTSPAARAPRTSSAGGRAELQPLLAQDAARQQQQRIYGNAGDGVDPNRNYPAKRGIDEEGATNTTAGETYRGPYALSEPENLAFDRLLRKIDFKANVNYHSAGQLLLTPVSYITDYAPVDATIFDAMTGVDGDGAVEPYTPQRSSDLYESNGDTIDNGYMNYGVIGWTPELDTCATAAAPAAATSSRSPTTRRRSRRCSEEPADGAQHRALGRPAGPSDELRQRPDALPDQGDAGHPADRFDVSYGATQEVEAIVRRSLGPVDVSATISGPAAHRARSWCGPRRCRRASATATPPACTSSACAR